MDNNKYISKYSNGKEVSAAQYITEIICENKAKKDGLDLHYRFWVNAKWSSFFRNQIASAHKLLKKYPDVAIVKALKNNKASKIYSLRAPHLIAIIEDEVEILKNQNTKLNISLNRYDNITFGNTTNTNKKNIFSKLKDIDNEH